MADRSLRIVRVDVKVTTTYADEDGCSDECPFSIVLRLTADELASHGLPPIEPGSPEELAIAEHAATGVLDGFAHAFGHRAEHRHRDGG